MVIVSGNWRCYTTWVSRWIAEQGGWNYITEPYHLEGPAMKQCRATSFRLMLQGSQRVLNRYPGHNDKPDDEDAVLVRALFREMPHAFGDVQLAKIVQLPYWRLMRQVWSDCRIVFLERRLRSWLSSMARAHVVRNIVLSETIWADEPPWVPVAKEIAEREADVSRLAMYTLACYHLLRQEYNLRTLHEELGNDWLHVEGEQLMSQYEIEMPRLLAYCGLPIPKDDDLYLAAIPPGRTWNGQPWGWRDCCEVEDACKAHHDLIHEVVG